MAPRLFLLTLLAGCSASGVVTSQHPTSGSGTSGGSPSSASGASSGAGGTGRGGTSGGSTGQGGSSSGGRTATTGGTSVGTTGGNGTGTTTGGCAANPNTTALAFTAPAATAPDLVAPGRGAEDWQGQIDIDIPVEGTNTVPLDVYYRLNWTDLEGATQGSYTFTYFDSLMQAAIDAGQKFSFGIMTTCPGCPNNGIDIGGNLSGYPLYVHTGMQAEAVPDWVSGGLWVPNWNSPTYLTDFANLLVAINAHLEATSYKGFLFADVIGYIDVRGYGSFGEWHVAGLANDVSSEPAGTAATSASLTSLIDAHVSAFPNQPLVALICAFNGGVYNNMGAEPDVGYHALTVANNFGPLGWRRDNWGDASDSYIDGLLDQNPTVYSGLAFSQAIMTRYQTSPVVGEPYQSGTNAGGSCDYWDLPTEVGFYHATSFGNGNINDDTTQQCLRDNVRAASAAAGYRLTVTGGRLSATLAAGTAFDVSLDWQNLGVAPSYESWKTTFELRDGSGTAVFTGISSFQPKLFLPDATPTTVTDHFVLPAGLAAGSYDLVLVVRDPNGYRSPLPLWLTGVQSDGSYLVTPVTLGAPCP